MARKAATEDAPNIINTTIPIDLLKSHPRNYRSHPDLQLERLGVSLAQFSQYRSIVVQSQDDGSYLLVAGHGLAEAAKRNGLTHLRADVLPSSWDAAKITAILVADNLSSATAEDDDTALAQLLEESKSAGVPLEAMGFSDDALAALLADLANETLDEEEKVPTFKDYDESIADDLPTELCQQCGKLCLKNKS